MRTSGRPALRRAAQRLVRRRHIDDPIDRLRFRIDTFPRRGPLRRLAWVGYQPLPWVGLNDAERGEGTLSRWEAIRPWVERTGCDSAVDLGCDRGFFALSLAAGGLAVDLPETVELLPTADAVLFLSLWHHLVRTHGLEAATAMLSAIWQRSRKLLFFDTGESEMPTEYGLPPMAPTPREWLADYLASACPGAEVVHCSTHDAYAPHGTRCGRNLFAVVRRAAVQSDGARRSET